jgi:pyruvate formate lyase activating enzyme
MIIGGLEKFTNLDYPGRLAAVVFTQGCNFRCRFCYNPMLVWPSQELGEKYGKDPALITEEDLFLFLKSRVGKLEAVVITGGEPTLHPDLPEFISKIKALGYLVKLDTNGSRPADLKRALAGKQIDYLAMDLKAPEALYEQVTGKEADFKKIGESVKLIKESGIPHEFRTTVVPGLLGVPEIEAMGEILAGAERWYLQKFKSDTDLVDRSLEKKPSYTDVEMEAYATIGRCYVAACEWR